MSNHLFAVHTVTPRALVSGFHCLQVPGLVNVDFADVRAIMENAGSSLMGIGTATGTSIMHNFFPLFMGFY